MLGGFDASGPQPTSGVRLRVMAVPLAMVGQSQDLRPRGRGSEQQESISPMIVKVLTSDVREWGSAAAQPQEWQPKCDLGFWGQSSEQGRLPW